MIPFTEHYACKSRIACLACRNLAGTGVFPLICPYSITIADAEKAEAEQRYERTHPSEWRNTDTVSNCCGEPSP